MKKIYNSALLLALAIVSQNSFSQSTMTDVDGNTYNTVTIDKQEWMAENLRTTKYNDGTTIPISASSFNNSTPNYCWYENDSAKYAKPYGALYNWFVVSDGKLCPTGWHVPTDEEWTALSTFLGGDNVAGGKLKEKGTTHWNGLGSNAGATNETGFTAIPGGQRDRSDGVLFNFIGSTGLYWSATEWTAVEGYAWYRGFTSMDATISRGAQNVKLGLSVRCVKAAEGGSPTKIETAVNKVSAYPTLCNDFLRIESSENIKNVSVYNVSGVEVLSVAVNENHLKLNVSSLQKGIYMVRVQNKNVTETLKILKQ